MSIGIFRKLVFLEILGNFFLTRIVGLQSTGCIATKNGLLIKLPEGVLNFGRF